MSKEDCVLPGQCFINDGLRTAVLYCFKYLILHYISGCRLKYVPTSLQVLLNERHTLP